MLVRVIDQSFIYFCKTLPEVYARLNDPNEFDPTLTKRVVQIHTSDTTRQVTNSDYPLAFGQNYKVELVTKCGTVLSDITERFFMFQFVHQQTGVVNQYWEAIQLPSTYTTPVHFKISHWAGGFPLSGLVAYSSPFYISSSVAGTSSLTYWDSGIRSGIDYGTTTAKCRIRIKGSLRELDDATENQTYTQISNVDGTGTVIEKHTDALLFPRKYITEYTDNHGVRAFGVFRKHGVKYIDDVRATSVTQENTEILGSSNFRKGSWVVNQRESEYYVDSFQIAPNFALVSFSPTGLYTPDTFPSTLTGQFNQSFTLGEGSFFILDNEGVRIGNLTESDITITGANSFLINIASLSLPNGNYYVNFDAGLFVSIFGQTMEIIGDDTTWAFEISDGDWLAADWSPSDWLTG